MKILILMLVSCFGTTGLEEDDGKGIRFWEDSTGVYKVKAAFTDYDGVDVLLTLPNGAQKKIALELLSTADQKLVSKLIATEKSPEKNNSDPSDTVKSVNAVDSNNVVDADPPVEIAGPIGAASDSSSDSSSNSSNDSVNTNAIGSTSSVELDMDQLMQPPPASDGSEQDPLFYFDVAEASVYDLPATYRRFGFALFREPRNHDAAREALQQLLDQWPPRRDPVLVRLVINCLNSSKSSIRESAMNVLAAHDAEQSFPYIFSRVDDRSSKVSSRAYEILRELRDQRSIAPIANRLVSTNINRIASLLTLLGKDFPEQCEVAVLPYLEHADEDVRLRTCGLLGKFGTPNSLGALRDAGAKTDSVLLKAQIRASIRKIEGRSTAEPLPSEVDSENR